MGWNISISEHVVCGAPFGGGLAVIRRCGSKDILAGGVQIYNTAGVQIATIPWGQKLPVGLGWTDDEKLLLVLDDGSTLLYDLLGSFIRTFLMLPSSINQKIVKVCVWGHGLAALTDQMVLQVCDDVGVAAPQVYQMATGLSSNRPAISMVVLNPRFTSSGLVEVILSTSDKSVIIVDSNGPEDQLLQGRIQAPIVDMAVAPNGRFLACFTATGILTVMSTSFTTKVLDFDTSTSVAPLQMDWCGEDSVILYWKHFLLLIGPYGHWLKFPYTRALHIIAEADCCRIITDLSCELLQRVPGAIEMIHRIGSTHSAAMLYDAMEAFEDGDAKANENMHSVNSAEQLNVAIEVNILAALAELEPTQQKRYLRAAIYGKAFCSNSVQDGCIVSAVRKMRVLNHMRRVDPGIFLTALQYEWLAPYALIDRLLARKQHQVALSMCQLLGIAQDKVLIHWACARLRESVAAPTLDEHLRDEIKVHLPTRDCALPYVRIAAAADLIGRRRLAIMLLRHETCATEQVKLLLSMREYDCALNQAVSSMEVDVIHLALLSIERALSSAGVAVDSFYSLIAVHKDASSLLHALYREYLLRGQHKHKLLHNLFMNPSLPIKFSEAGNLAIKIGYREASRTIRFERMREAIALYAQSRDSQFQAKQTEEHLDLLETQIEFEARYGVACFLDMSVTESIYNLIALGASQTSLGTTLQSDALRIQRRFRVPDRRFCHIKVKALAASGQWAQFHAFAVERRPLIGYRPFILALVNCNQPTSKVLKYVDRVQSVDERFSLLVEFKLWRPAIETASRLNDLEKFIQLQSSSCNDPQLRAEISQQLIRLGGF
ncbi:vacuolar protein sorting (Vps) complex subunit [Aureococcus anophagefferens]|uniref:Vacuolar protein sorting (Vps) complex subunit n=2 Tax=Aureococcus anophagefferens TaxID=44056 RepID=A0ABR1FS02_AURAN|mmetsp:Transcript_21505/g.74219  ORF Transcript_21505/g.74219 Transcript_21505/m.74219 type:complete len:832 (+) Transcript_21505:206-2701(+)